MKELTIEEFEAMLCSTGYLPPRNEEELLFFEQLYGAQKCNLAGKHVDVESIINGSCHLVAGSVGDSGDMDSQLMENENIFDRNYSLAARNYNKLPKEVLEKMKEQHKPKDDNE